MTERLVSDVTRDKYAQEGERTLEDVMRRVHHAVMGEDPSGLEVLTRGRFCPGGRILASAGTGKLVTSFNCFVSPRIEDSMHTEEDRSSKGIMDALAVAAYTQQMGGGIGMDFSTLRPEGALVKKRGTGASGPLPFMDMWNAMCATVMSSGARRGAMMATMRCDHPDILKFIRAKREAGRLTNFNVSVLVTDAFMRSVEKDLPWLLIWPGQHVEKELSQTDKGYIYRIIPARELWREIMESTHESSEPGVIFIDQVNRMNNLRYCEEISATNPCGEQPLPPNGNCNLGAINLARMVRGMPFTDTVEVDWTVLSITVNYAVRFLDNVIDQAHYPTPEQEHEGKQKRRIGLGVMGLANMLQLLSTRYGSPRAVDITQSVMRHIANEAYKASSSLAAEKGSFPAIDRDRLLEAPFIQRLDDAVRERIRHHGLRNGVLLTVAPTGTTSIFMGNVSGGIEPVFANEYTRAVLQPDGSREEYLVSDWGFREWSKRHPQQPPSPIPGYLCEAHEVSIEEHLQMQAAAQEWVDSSISKTINLPAGISLEDFQSVYKRAWELELKGCTTYRPSEVRGSVLRTKATTVTLEDGELVEEQLEAPAKPPRPPELHGITYKVRWPGLEQAFYVTINDKEGRPFEVFINSKSIKHQEWITALTRTISAVFRRGGDVGFLVEELGQIHSAVGGQWVNGKYVPSLVAMIGGVIEQHLRRLGLYDGGMVEVSEVTGDVCPKCNMPAVTHQEGCEKCGACGWSSC